jgi:hypothetical protein
MALEQGLSDEDIQTPTGRLFRDVADLDFALRQPGGSMDVYGLTREQFLGLQALHAVRDEYQQERMERDRSSLPSGQKWHGVDR